jgi:hypothetical protein
LRLRSLPLRRPSAPIVISSAALFMSLGGVGYAASGLINTNQIANGAVTYQKIAPNSVGKVRLANGGVVNAKLARNAVTYRNITPGSVGTVRANLNQLQARVKGTCAAGQAVGAIDNKGNVTCNAALAPQIGTTAATATVTGASTPVSTVTLPAGGTYLGFGNVQVTADSGPTAQRVTVVCNLTVGASTVGRTVVLRTTGTAGDGTDATLPLQSAGVGGPSTLACTASVPAGQTLPTITALGQINALQTASNS